jgi:hypothetical protein
MPPHDEQDLLRASDCELAGHASVRFGLRDGSAVSERITPGVQTDDPVSEGRHRPYLHGFARGVGVVASPSRRAFDDHRHRFARRSGGTAIGGQVTLRAADRHDAQQEPLSELARVGFHRVRAEVEILRDLRVAESAGDQVEAIGPESGPILTGDPRTLVRFKALRVHGLR